ncbi:MAG: MFS transporter [Desulfobacteraceae bacterium]|nr:MAG: MFS transporter [Desulfobacteraceae bacterium]
MKLFDRDDYRYSFFDGMSANIYGTLTGSLFLTGFALYLGMNELMIGLMMAIPSVVTLFQLPGSYYICRKGCRKPVAYRAATIARLMWLPIIALGLVHFDQSIARCMLVLFFFLVLHALSSVSYIAWISWTSDLVPDEIRGIFFGTRNMLCGAAGIATVLIFGNLVDIFKVHCESSSLVFSVPFGCAVVFGLISSHYLNRIADVPVPPYGGGSFFQELSRPLKDNNFRKFLLFAVCWNFSVHMAAPFFSLYFLRELNYSYGFVALLTTIAAVADLLAVRIWGVLSDQVKNKAVIQLTGWGVVLLPALWVMVRPQDVLVPVLLQIISGGFWSGVALCTNNLLLRISPQQGRVWFISAHSISVGLGAAVAPVVGGFFLSMLNSRSVGAETGGILPLHYLFMASTVLRMLSLLLFSVVHESHEKSLRQTIRILSGMRRLGFVTTRGKMALVVSEIAKMPRKVPKFVRALRRPVARQQM